MDPEARIRVERCIWVDQARRWQRCPGRSVSVWMMGDLAIAGICRDHLDEPRLTRSMARLGARKERLADGSRNIDGRPAEANSGLIPGVPA